MVEIRESEFMPGWIGLYTEDDNGHPEETLTLSKRSATQLMNDINEFLTNKAKKWKNLNRESTTYKTTGNSQEGEQKE